MQSNNLLVAKVCWVSAGGKQKHQVVSSYSARALPQSRKAVGFVLQELQVSLNIVFKLSTLSGTSSSDQSISNRMRPLLGSKLETLLAGCTLPPYIPPVPFSPHCWKEFRLMVKGWVVFIFSPWKCFSLGPSLHFCVPGLTAASQIQAS